MKRAIHRSLRGLGWHVQRWRDPYDELASILGQGRVKVAVDGGAYRGGSTEKLWSLFPGCTVHAFEPQRSTFEELERRLAGRSSARLFNQALSDKPGTATLRLNEKAFTSSLMATNRPDQMHPAGEEQVVVTTLDDWAEKEGVTPEFIKLDLQGNELAALRGATKVLGSGSLLAVLAEVNFQKRYVGSCLYFEVAARLAEFGMHLHRMYEIVAEPNGRWRHADALFLKDFVVS